MLRGFIMGCTLLLMPASAAFGQQAGERRIDQFLCKDVMRETGGDRDVMIAFLHGYMLGKGGAGQFDLEQLRRESDRFVEHCLDNPGEKAAAAMAGVKTPAR